MTYKNKRERNKKIFCNVLTNKLIEDIQIGLGITTHFQKAKQQWPYYFKPIKEKTK